MKTKSMKRFLALLMAMAMVLCLMSGCGTETETSDPTEAPTEASNGNAAETQEPEETAEPYTGADTLVVGESNFSQKFSPFFAKTTYDLEIADLVSVVLLDSDREANMLLNSIDGETVAYNGTDYTYYGLANCVVTQNDDGTITYDFELRDDIVFSDGEPLTADDVIFSMYVYSDPNYAGSTTFSSLPIVGMQEYQTGVSSAIYDKYAALADEIYAAGQDDTSHGELGTAYWGDIMDAAGQKFAADICNYCVSEYSDYLSMVNNDEVALGMYVWGYGDFDDDGNFVIPDENGSTFDLETAFPTYEDYWNAIYYSNDGDLVTIDTVETANTSLFTFAKQEFIATMGPLDEEAGGSIDSIAGIVKNNDYSLTVTMSEFDATAIYQFNMAIAPLHYYGDVDQYDYENNQFGFPKGDLSIVQSKTTTPLGAGPYKFVSYENGVVTLTANENYWKGCPKITNLLFQETSSDDKLTGVVSGTFDLSNINFNDADVAAIKEYNDSGELTGNIITTIATDFNGYGYIGINADNVKVGDQKDSEASKNLRKGLATLFAVYRDTAIDSYYGDRAAIINYPITNCSWAAPRSSDEGYTVAYSTAVDGTPIYSADMTEEQKYEAALSATVEYLKAAGYTWDEASGKFTAAPAGAEMAYEVICPADGTGNHPSFGICTAAKEALASIGITLEINDPSDSNVIWNVLEAGEGEIWCAAWGGSADPDMKQVYYSTNVVGLEGSTESNHYGIQDAELDELIDSARSSADNAYRKGLYKQCLDIIMDWGVEIPVYQRQEAYVYSTERINMDTMTPDITTYWSWYRDIQNLEMN